MSQLKVKVLLNPIIPKAIEEFEAFMKELLSMIKKKGNYKTFS